MPHIIVEYSNGLGPSLNVPEMLQDLHATLAGQETVDLDRIKTRAIGLENVVVGSKGSSGTMVHVTLKLLPRPDELAKTMASALHATVRGYVPEDCAVTVETMTLNANTYCV